MMKRLTVLATAMLLPYGASTQTVEPAKTVLTPLVTSAPRLPFDANSPQTWAPLTKYPIDKLPPEMADAVRMYERIVGPANAMAPVSTGVGGPQFVINAAVPVKNNILVRPKTCLPEKQTISARWLPLNQNPEESPESYYGDGVNCAPDGYGMLTYRNGTVWIGEVAEVYHSQYIEKNGSEKALKKKQSFIAVVPVGVGILRTRDRKKYGGGLIVRSVFKSKADVTQLPMPLQQDPQLKIYAIPKTIVPIGRLYETNYAVGLDHAGNGQGQLFYADGNRLTALFKNAVVAPKAIGRHYLPNGDQRSGEVAFTGRSGVKLTGIVEETLRNPDPISKVPAGKYLFFHSRGEDGDWVRELIRPLGETLFAGGPKPAHCLEPSFRPADWVTFWPMCRDKGTNKQGKSVPAFSVSFSPNGEQAIWEYFGDGAGSQDDREKWQFFWQQLDSSGKLVRSVAANMLTTAPVFGPVGFARASDSKGEFAGEFLGLVPNGPGTCRLWEEKGSEPCFYANGVRTDEIHLARQELKALELETKRENERIAAERAAERQRIELVQQNHEINLAEARRQAEQAEIDAENAEIDAQNAAQGNPIANVFADLNDKFRVAAEENRRGWEEVDAINAEQRRQAEERAAAARAEQSRQAQVNAEASQARNQQIAQAQAQSAAEAQRRHKEVRARLEAAKQKAAADRAIASQASVNQSNGNGTAGGQASAAAVNIIWLEGVVICPAKEGFIGSTMCHGPFQNALVNLTVPAEIARACGTSQPVRNMGTLAGNRVYGCGFGINPTQDSSPHIDQANRFGINVPNRQIYRCPQTQSTICR